MSKQKPLVDRNEVEVSKEFVAENEEFRVPVVRFEIKSKKDEPIVIRLLDTIPTEFSQESVGFHEEFEGKYWDFLEGNRLAFERELEGNETVETLYGIQGPDEDDAFLFEESEPTVYTNSPEDGEDYGAEDVKENISDMDNGETVDTDNEESSVSDKNQSDESEDGVNGKQDENKSEEKGDGQSDSAPESLKVQVQHLQSQMQTFGAYIEALEEFIDEEGTGEEVIRKTRDDIEEINQRISSAEDELEDRLSDIEADVEEVSQMEEDISQNRKTIAEVEEIAREAADESNIDEERIEEVEEDIEEIQDTLQQIQEQFGVLRDAFGS